MLEHGISAVPVVAGERLIGIVSEGDLMRRPETGTERQRSWCLTLLTGPETLARDYAHAHGRQAADVTTCKLVTVRETTPLSEIARVLEVRCIKRVPVVRSAELRRELQSRGSY